MTDSLTHEAFSKCLQTKFRVEVAPETSVDLELIEVSELKVSPRQEQFAIVFRGPNDFFLGQGMREMEHVEMGQVVLFLVPISQDAQGYRYEAVFNRIAEPAEKPG